MSRFLARRHRLALGAAALVLSGAVIFLLLRVNEWETVRYQAVGRVVDAEGSPLSGVEVALLLTPPPADGPARDALFEREGLEHGRMGKDGTFTGTVGPAVGLSDAGGAFIVRTSGRLGAAHAIRLGLDSSGRPPFRTAWLVLRRPDRPDATRTLSLLGWRPSPKGWGTFANRIPLIVLAP